MSNNALLEVENVTVEFATRRGPVQAVKNVSIQVRKGETVAIVGESGSGKSVTSYAVARILDRAGKVVDGSIKFSGIDLVQSDESQMRNLRGREISMIFQNPRAALNPIRKVGEQIEDVLIEHLRATRETAKAAAIEALAQVKISKPQERYHAYPFELSGGMCQRVVIALALACRPQLLIADEPTTGLDVTTQKAVMDLIVQLTRERHMSTVLITHDLGLAAAYCDRIVVMEKGRVVETAPAQEIFKNPQHPYTRRLMMATPRVGMKLRDLLPVQEYVDIAEPALDTKESQAHKEESLAGYPLLQVRDLYKIYPANNGGGFLKSLFKKADIDGEGSGFRAVNGVSFDIAKGETVGLVGESGCGKSTTSMMLARLTDPTSGKIIFNGINLADIPAAKFSHAQWRARIQMVFQDPTESLNPRFTAERAIADPILCMGDGGRLSRDELRARCEHLAGLVGLPVELLDRFPHQLSGGQKARVGIARAIALEPELVILDEPTAALDVSVQAVVLNLLEDLKNRLGMSYLFVSHDLNVVRLLCDRIVIMKDGKIVEQGKTIEVLENPKALYTQKLLSAIPHPPG